ncbi:ABC transporter permease [Dyadobacter luticola]|uniref:FtsX-like permease family protein n=1 Tax=Dyadobacter luticola TaxID=1979387 RepID=A0A5R9KXJ8_9BACT|nr:ABC transporter permease [Dyadobacter luticola]TLV01022.1 FtsX-like permease family protein [Dyadobacter luticola]
MLENYFKIAWRSLRNKKAFAIINILGLAIGLATCMLILLFVQHELSYDKFNANADRIFRLTFHGSIGGKEINIANAPAPAGPAVLRDYAEIETFTRIKTEGSFLVKYDQKQFKETRVAFADSNFFDVFTFPLLKGNPKTALSEPNTVVVTETTSTKYFGKKDPVGQSLKIGDRLFRVTGVAKDVPSNAHFHFDFFCNIKGANLGEKWLASGATTYLLLKKGVQVAKLNAKSSQIVRKYIGPELQEFLGMSYDEYLKKGDSFSFKFQPLTDIHLHSNLESELDANGNVKYVYIFSVIAAFILLIACINFMNLSTAGSAGRAREVGIRKAMGSVRMQLVRQFLTESVMLTFIALLAAFVVVILVLPQFNELAGKQFDLHFILNPKMIACAIAGCLVVGILAGSYPAFFLSSFKPIAVLKGKMQLGIKTGWLRNSLVTIQFVVSIGMIIGTIVVYQQLRFIQNKKLGFDKEQVLILQDTYLLGDKSKAFKEEVAKLSQVADVTLAGYIPAGPSNNGTDGYVPEDAGSNTTAYRFRTYQIDEHYLPTLGIKLAAGRNFSKSFGTDSAAVLVNEAVVKQFGWKNPIGKTIRSIGNGSPGSVRTYKVIGVTKDFHFESFHTTIAPLVMAFGGDGYQIALRLRTDNVQGVISLLEKKWKATTDAPFSYSFMDERFNQMYLSEQRIGALFGIFAGLAVVIACLGLFGLAAFTTIQRTKEIGVRKVLGASVFSIVSLLSKDFVRLVALAILIASPLAWYGMHTWLKDFAYKINIEWWVFALAGVVAIGIALLTVSYESIRAALVNPVKSLKSE